MDLPRLEAERIVEDWIKTLNLRADYIDQRGSEYLITPADRVALEQAIADAIAGQRQSKEPF